MTIAQLLASFKSLLNQHVAGFYDDTTDLYIYLNNAQNTVVKTISENVAKQRTGKNRLYHCRTLEPLEVVDTATTTTATIMEYTLPSDYMLTQYMEYDSTGVGTPAVRYPATLRTMSEALFRQRNNISKAKATEPSYYIRSNKFGLLPVPTVGALGCFLHYYWKKPIEIISANSASVIPLKDECIQPILEVALYYAMIQVNREDVGMGFYKNAMVTVETFK